MLNASRDCHHAFSRGVELLEVQLTRGGYFDAHCLHLCHILVLPKEPGFMLQAFCVLFRI